MAMKLAGPNKKLGELPGPSYLLLIQAEELARAQELAKSEFPMLAAQIGRLRAATLNTNLADFMTILGELGNRIEEELASKVYLEIKSDRDLYENNVLFGVDVEARFAGASEDISEAGKCLALGRFTASVFHLMRVMEIGVQEFADALGVPLAKDKVWQVLLDQINTKIKAMSTKDPATPLMASVAAHLYTVKVAWRNEVMHPKATYTEEEAKRIFEAMRSYMQELAGVGI
jgi:hypothetical protein